MNWYTQKADELKNTIDTLKVQKELATGDDEQRISARIQQLSDDRINYIGAAEKAGK